jgi:hypothetical protein
LGKKDSSHKGKWALQNSYDDTDYSKLTLDIDTTGSLLNLRKGTSTNKTESPGIQGNSIANDLFAMLTWMLIPRARRAAGLHPLLCSGGEFCWCHANDWLRGREIY